MNLMNLPKVMSLTIQTIAVRPEKEVGAPLPRATNRDNAVLEAVYLLSQ